MFIDTTGIADHKTHTVGHSLEVKKDGNAELSCRWSCGPMCMQFLSFLLLLRCFVLFRAKTKRRVSACRPTTAQRSECCNFVGITTYRTYHTARILHYYVFVAVDSSPPSDRFNRLGRVFRIWIRLHRWSRAPVTPAVFFSNRQTDRQTDRQEDIMCLSTHPTTG